MLVTHAEFMHARPMALHQRDFDGTLWFFTNRSSPKTYEIENNPEVCVTFADPGTSTFVSLTGYATLSEDERKIDELWTADSSLYFDGRDDPDLVLLRIDVQSAEYWDQRQNRMVQVFEIVKAGIFGYQPALTENRKFS